MNVSGAGTRFREIAFETTSKQQYSAIWIIGGSSRTDVELCEFTGPAYGQIRAQQAFDGLAVRHCYFHDCNAGVVINDPTGAGIDFRNIDVSFKSRARLPG